VSFARIASALALVAALAFFPMSAHAQAQPDVARANDTQAPTGTDQSQAESPSAASPTKSDYPEGLNPDAALLARLSGLFNVEDPTSIYDFGINDNNVEFVLDGTWETRFDSFLNITIDKGTSTMSFTPPVFTQAVDLSSWILINDTWYFESSFQEQFTKNTVAAGYIGGEDDPVKHVRIGNSGITFPDAYPFVTIGGGAAIAPGVMGTFGGKNWDADAIIRYDAAASRSLTLSGMNEVADEFVPVANFVRGKWFVLPDAHVSGAVTVYVTDDDGAYRDGSARISGRRWRKLEQTEYTVHGTDGILELKNETAESVAVVYYGGYAASSSSPGASLVSFIGETREFFDGITQSMPSGYLPDPTSPGYSSALADRFLLDINGAPALLVRERGHFSPFEILSRYRAESSEPALVYTETGISPKELAVDDFDGVYVEAFRTDGNAATGIRDTVSRYPLAYEFPTTYLPSGGGQKADTDLAVRNRTWKPISNIALGANVIAGTIQVTRNGIADTAFQFDDETGILTLVKDPATTETVRITWYDTDDSARNATLTIGGGARWRPTGTLSLFSATAFRWNISKSGYTDSEEQSPGSFILSAGTAYTGENAKASTAFALDVSVPDTTGYYRALGMDSGTNELYPSDDWYQTVGDDIDPSLGLPVNASPIKLDHANRVETAGTDGDQCGTVTDSAMTGSVLVLSCSLPSSASWAGASVLTEKNADIDWSSVSTVSLWLKNPGTDENFDVYLQLGTGTEDSGEDPETVRTWKLETPAHGGEWIKRTVTLSDADRAALTANQNARIIVVPAATSSPTAATPLAVTLRSGMLSYTDTGFAAKAEPRFTGTTGKLTVEETTDPAPVTLIASGADQPRRFNSGSVNTVLVARFTPEADTERVRLSSHVPMIPLSQYRELSFFVYADTLPSASSGSLFRVRMTRPATSGSGVATALELELSTSALSAGAWQEVTVDLESKEVSVGGVVQPITKARVVTLNRDKSPTRVEFSMEGWPVPGTGHPAGTAAYTVALDELYLAQSDTTYTFRNKSEYSWKKNGAVLSVGRAAIVSDPSISLTADSSVRKDGSEPMASGTAAGGLSLLRARADGTITASSETARVADSTSHSVTVPFGPLSLHESYAADFTESDFERSDSVSLSGPLALNAATGVQSSGRNLIRTANFGVTPRFPATGIGAFRLSGTSAFTQTGISPAQDITHTDWGDLWTDTFHYSLSTGESDATKRAGKTSFEAGWTTERGSGVSLECDASSAYASSSSVTIGSTFAFTLSAPIRLGFSTITPSWTRTGKETCSTDEGGSYYGDTDFLMDSFPRLRYLYSTAPFADLFESDICDRIADSSGIYARSFENSYGVSWSRPSLGKLSDLWIPSTIDTSLGRKTETDATVSNVSDEWNATVRAGFSALNMAGAFGARRIFKWYDQDEISQLYAWNGKWGNNWFTWNVDTLHSLMLLFPKNGSFVTDNAFHYDSPDIAGDGRLVRDTIRVIWKRPGKDSFVSALVQGWTKLPLTTTREETFSFTVTRSDTDSEALSYDHVLRTGIGANGEVSLNSGLGWTRASNDITTIELRLGIGGKLTY
jgi:DNA polymerase-4